PARNGFSRFDPGRQVREGFGSGRTVRGVDQHDRRAGGSAVAAHRGDDANVYELVPGPECVVRDHPERAVLCEQVGMTPCDTISLNRSVAMRSKASAHVADVPATSRSGTRARAFASKARYTFVSATMRTRTGVI